MRQKKLLRSGISLVLVLVILTSLVVPVSALSGDQLTSSGACVMDAKTGDVLWSHNGDTQLVPASLTKVMTVYLVFEAISAGTISKDTVVPISSAIAQFSLNPVWSNVPLLVNTTYTVDGIKTGSSTPAGYCLSVSAYRGDQRLITVALRSTSPNGRYYDSQKLLDYGFSQLDTMLSAGAKYTDPALLTLDLAGTVSGVGAYWIGDEPYVNPRDVACLLNGILQPCGTTSRAQMAQIMKNFTTAS